MECLKIKEMEQMLSSVSAHLDRGNIETAKVYLSELYKVLKEMKEENEL